MSSSQETLQRLRPSLKFGMGCFVGSIDNRWAAFTAMQPQDQVRVAGWANGCPVPDECIKTSVRLGQSGSEAMLRRYGAVNFWFKQMVMTAAEQNESLADAMISPVRRRTGVGSVYETNNVPLSYYMAMPPLCVLPNFAAARILVGQISGSDNPRQPYSADRVATALVKIGLAARETQTPYDFAAVFAESMVDEGVGADTSANLLLNQGWLLEQNDPYMFGQQRNAVMRCAPRIWHYYQIGLTQKPYKAPATA